MASMRFPLLNTTLSCLLRFHDCNVMKKSNENYRANRTKLLDFVALQGDESFSCSNDRESKRAPVRRCLSSEHFQTCLPDFLRSFLALLFAPGLFGLMAPLGKLSFVSRRKSGCIMIDSGNDETVAINFRSTSRFCLTKETGGLPFRPAPRVLIYRFPM